MGSRVHNGVILERRPICPFIYPRPSSKENRNCSTNPIPQSLSGMSAQCSVQSPWSSKWRRYTCGHRPLVRAVNLTIYNKSRISLSEPTSIDSWREVETLFLTRSVIGLEWWDERPGGWLRGKRRDKSHLCDLSKPVDESHTFCL